MAEIEHLAEAKTDRLPRREVSGSDTAPGGLGQIAAVGARCLTADVPTAGKGLVGWTEQREAQQFKGVPLMLGFTPFSLTYELFVSDLFAGGGGHRALSSLCAIPGLRARDPCPRAVTRGHGSARSVRLLLLATEPPSSTVRDPRRDGSRARRPGMTPEGGPRYESTSHARGIMSPEG
jgi:hypothetical protein